MVAKPHESRRYPVFTTKIGDPIRSTKVQMTPVPSENGKIAGLVMAGERIQAPASLKIRPASPPGL